MKVHDSMQKGIEKLFFKGKSTKGSRKLTYIIGNLILMVVLFFILVQLILYDWTGDMYPEGTGYRLDWVFGPLDNLIPFVPEMAIFYIYMFFPMVVLTMIYFTFFESDKGYALGWSLVFIGYISILIYIFFPVSTYWWRQDLLAHKIKGNFWATTMYGYYEADPSFNCLPSLHASASTIIFYTWYRYNKIKPSLTTKIIAIATFVIAVAVILSTLFVKQHYIIDEVFGIFLAYIVGKYMFFFLWKDFEKKERN